MSSGIKFMGKDQKGIARAIRTDNSGNISSVVTHNDTEYQPIPVGRNDEYIIKQKEIGKYTRIIATVQDSDYIYAGGFNQAASIRKIDKKTMKLAGTASVPYPSNVRALEIDDDYIYVGGDYGKIQKLNKNTMELVRESSMEYGGTIREIAQSGEYLYICGINKVQKLSKVTLDVVKTSSDLHVETGTTPSVAVHADKVYVSTSSSNLPIFELNSSDLSVTGNNSSKGIFASIKVSESFLYAGGTDKIRKFNLSNMELVGENTISGSAINKIDICDKYVYVVDASGVISKFKKDNDLDLVSESTSIEVSIPTVCVDGEHIYIGDYIGSVTKYNHVLYQNIFWGAN